MDRFHIQIDLKKGQPEPRHDYLPLLRTDRAGFYNYQFLVQRSPLGTPKHIQERIERESRGESECEKSKGFFKYVEDAVEIWGGSEFLQKFLRDVKDKSKIEFNYGSIKVLRASELME